jgi:predicted esterase
MYSWNDWDWAISVLEKLYATICKQYPVDKQQVVLAGFSMGAGLALWLALNEIIKVQGVIAVAPFLTDVEKLKPLLDKHAGNLRIFLVASQEDRYCYDVAIKLAELLPQYDIQHKLDIYADVGHAFPSSFEPELPNALEFVLSRPT